MTRSSLTSNQQGLSLMEMVVAVGVFSILALLTMGLFGSTLRGQQTALAQIRVEREAQLILEILSKKIRSSRVDYASYPSGTVGTSEETLYLIDQTDARLSFTYNTTDDALDLVIDGGSPEPLSSGNVSVTDLDFFISPTTDPFTAGSVPNTQPRVTVVITIESTKGISTARTVVQQTIPQRRGLY